LRLASVALFAAVKTARGHISANGASRKQGFVPAPGGYRKRKPEDYDRALCLVPRDVLDFVLAA